MRLADLLNGNFRDFPVDWTMRVLESVAAYDRYQASEGIEKAADVVAAAADEAGLVDMSITSYDVTHNPKWWTFQSPRPWTPRSASLEIVAGSQMRAVVRYPANAMCLATYSAPCLTAVTIPLYLLDQARADEVLEGRLDPRIRGALIVLCSSRHNLASVCRSLENSGTLGIAADPLAQVREQRGLSEERGRIELSPTSSFFAFSLLPREIALLERAAQGGQHARVHVDVERTGRMPLVQGVIPAVQTNRRDAEPEILVQAHLCHPGPGANDNASGIAASLGIARLLARRDNRSARHPIRFLFAPEFVGTAAYLHEFVVNGPQHKVAATINLDMVGENQALSGSALIVENSPDHVPSCLGALAAKCLELLPHEKTSYSGAVPIPDFIWRSTPFCGASDHSLFADRMFSIPAIQFSHWPDRFNHTSADAVDKVCPKELRRSGSVAATCAEVFSRGTAENGDELARVAAFAVAREMASLYQREVHAPVSECVDPFSSDHLPRLVDHMLQTGKRQVASTGAGEHLFRWLEREAQACCDVAMGWEQPQACGKSRPITRCWEGPFNLRGLLDECSQVHAQYLREKLERDRGAFPRMLALALGIDNTASRAQVVQHAAYSSRLAIVNSFADAFFNALTSAGWIIE